MAAAAADVSQSRLRGLLLVETLHHFLNTYFGAIDVCAAAAATTALLVNHKDMTTTCPKLPYSPIQFLIYFFLVVHFFFVETVADELLRQTATPAPINQTPAS